MGHFARECRAPRSKEGQFRNQDNTRKQGNNEDTSSKAMLVIDGIGFDWSDMIEEQVQTNMALMAFPDSEQLLITVEEQLITYRKNEVLFSEDVAVFKREVACKDYEINVLKSEFEKVKQEKEGIEFKIEKFDKASKDLDKLLESQITDKSKKGLGYSVVPPPYPLIYNRPKKLDLSYSGLDEFKEPEFKGHGSEDSKKESNVVYDKKSDDSKENYDKSLVKEQVSKDTSSFVESSLNVDKETVFPVDKKVEFVKPKNHEKPVKKSVRYAEMYRSQTPRGNQRNWNGQKSNQLGSDFVMYNKACFICGSFNHVQAQCKYHQRERMVYGSNYNRVNYNYTTKRTHPNAQRNMVPRAVLMKTGLKTFNTARTVNTAHPKSTVFSAKPMSCFPKTAQSTVRRPFQSKTALSNKRFTHKVNTAKAQAVNTARPQAVNTARPKTVKTARPNSAVVNAVRVNQANAGKPQQDDTGFVDSGCSRHMTGNIAYLSDFKEFDGGYVTFGGGAHGGRISGKGTLKTDSLDFEDVYFVNELKFNLFSVSQMCDKKNYVLFTDTECLVLSPNFKLPDESQILLKIPRKDNMYSFDMKNISDDDSSPKEVNAAGQHVNTASPDVNTGSFKLNVINPQALQKLYLDSILGEACRKELLKFKLQQVWIHVDLLIRKRAIRTKWVFRNKKDERGIVIRNKARLVAQGHRQEQGIDYEEVFAPVAEIMTIRLFLAYASFMGFLVYQMDVKSACLYGTIKEEVYVTQPPGFKDPNHPDKVYKMVKALYGLHQAPRAWIASTTEGRWNIYQLGKYVAEILKKFNYANVKSASTPFDLEKPLVKDGDADDVDVHLYRSMIWSLMYLTTSRPDIMFAYKKQTMVATSTTEDEYVAAASCCGQKNSHLPNDVFAQPFNDDEASFHEDASENGTASNKPKQKQQQLIPITTTISNIKLPILKKEKYDIWAMEMEHYLEYIDNDV
ncbi:putative ribonuclease H-like domain-containing protein [Tanacetum coccineum]